MPGHFCAQQGRLRRRGDALDILAHARPEDVQEMTGQDQDVLAAFPQRRQVELHDIQPVEQVLAKFTGGDRLCRCRGSSRQSAAH